MRKVLLAATLAAAFGAVPAIAQVGSPTTRPTPPTGFDIPISRPPAGHEVELPDPKPVYRYELKPEHGEYLVLVKTFQGAKAGDETGRAKALAEGLVEWIRTECRLYAYVYESGWTKRQERQKEKEAVEAAARKYYKSQGKTDEETQAEIRKVVKLARIPDEYSVLVAPGKGTLKTFDEALDFARYLREVASKKAPPDEYCNVGAIGSAADGGRRGGAIQNPLAHGMPGHNPTIPRKQSTAQRPKADEFLMSLNAGKPYSLIHKTTKPFTLVVKAYGAGTGPIQKPGEAFAATPKPPDGELLERAAHQAQTVAKMLRQQKPPFDAYVLHTRYESFVCVGEYDTKDDPQLKANAKTLGGLALKTQKGEIIETFMEKPLPAMIPRP